jgi:hypothetical protein
MQIPRTKTVVGASVTTTARTLWRQLQERSDDKHSDSKEVTKLSAHFCLFKKKTKLSALSTVIYFYL